MQTIGGDEVTVVTSLRKQQVEANAKICAQWTVSQWEDYLNAIDPNFMELGLQRIDKVARRLHIQDRLQQSQAYVVCVAGTNGKGSTCALIAQAMTNMGFKTGLYTSPHLVRFNERIQLDMLEINDQLLCQCLSQVVQAQVQNDEFGYIDLSYFEIITLAAWLAFLQENCQVWVLEIGLGGRLDAVNLIKHHVSVITSIGLDHMKILGDSVEKIAFEKAGIIHEQDYTILGQNIPVSALNVIKQVADEKQATLKQELVDFNVELLSSQTTAFTSNLTNVQVCLGTPKIPFICAAPALQAVFYLLQLMHNQALSVTQMVKLNQAFTSVALPGRMQLVQQNPDVYLDVAHNVPAALNLKAQLQQRFAVYKRRIAVIGMLKDKDIEGVLQTLHDSFDSFYVASLHVPRGETKERLATALQESNKSLAVFAYDNVSLALSCALQKATSEDVIVVLGSFITVSEAKQALER